jgi:hypothetical protein
MQADIPCDEAHVRFHMALSVRSINTRLSFYAAYLHASLRLYYVLLPLVGRFTFCPSSICFYIHFLPPPQFERLEHYIYIYIYVAIHIE